MNGKAVLAICGVFVGCCCNVVFLELLVKNDPGAGHLITFSQFFFIACHGLIFTSKFFTVKPVIALRDYMTLVVMFFVSSVCNNYAFNFNIPMPLHMIFRAGSLMANMIMGIIILQRSYDSWKYTSVILITFGIIICTVASGATLNRHKGEQQDNEGFGVLFWWCIGILLLTVALFVSARMGIYQETLFKKFGKHPNEALFYTHVIPLPGFLLLYRSIHEHVIVAMQSQNQSILGINMPIQIAYVIGNMLTQYVCISSVYVLTTECPSLTVTLVVTLRKFASLLFSIIYFKNKFTFYHWVGTAFVFVGTVIYTEIIPKVRDSLRRQSIQQVEGAENENGEIKAEPTKMMSSFYKKIKKHSRHGPAPLLHVEYQAIVNED